MDSRAILWYPQPVSTTSRAQTNAIPAQRSLRAFLISSGSPILTAALIFFVLFQADVADGKRKSVPAVQPELQIVAVGLFSAAVHGNRLADVHGRSRPSRRS